MQTHPQELLLDDTQDVISLDKPTLSFTLCPSSTPDNAGIYGKSESTMMVKNLTNSHVAIRTKTTKKDVYAVNPTYGIINPSESFEIKFVYYIKDLRENPKKHKFKFEGMVFDPKAHPNKDSKGLFDHYIASQIRVKGNAIRREVVFHFANSEKNVILSQEENIPNVSTVNVSHSEKNIIVRNQVYPNANDNVGENYINNNMKNMNSPTKASNLQKNEGPFQQNLNMDSAIHNSNINSNQNFTKPPPNKETEKQLQDMKIEYYKYKHQLNNLSDTYKNLKSRADIEKKGPETNLISVNVSQSPKEEKQIKKNIVLILFTLSILLGFFLSR